MSYGVSDHKPVVASFSLEVGDSWNTLPPLLGGPLMLTSSLSPAAEEVFRHPAGVHLSRGGVERRRGCMSDLHRPRRLHVVYLGLDWPVQGTGIEDHTVNPASPAHFSPRSHFPAGWIQKFL